ncbi:hypothetical protein NA57DRAFT_64863 [Rhizodiscina lignyota]|uniref:L-tryptophan decarboxylase PsiD-like domain-containing protein n=1 Tax=Rhizodiscina lignyota TaxID=1504668 RepID=A0A9P4MBZ7_9PEZI|nr:hypothetical protein NA57DRAFT_64863 [Rhizodiscina lignyota]
MVVQHGDEHDIPHEHRVHRTGGWLPADHRVTRHWLKKTIEHVDNNPEELVPILKEFKKFIEGNTRVFYECNAMFEEIPNKKPYCNDPTGTSQIRDYSHMLDIFNHVLTTAPQWTDAAESVGMVGVPLHAIFDWPMGTPSGHTFFLDQEVNVWIKKVLNEWGKYLLTPESAEVLGDHTAGWFGPTGKKDLLAVANDASGTSLGFEEIFVCDPSAKHYGYKSWDDFFTRKVKDSARPVASPDDDNVIANCCESRPYNVAHGAKLRDRFWIKGQPYSVLDMVAHDKLAEQFEGATIYQAFLSALSYHRWHTPVSGKIVKAWVEDGTYFSEPLFEGIGDPTVKDIDPHGLATAQGYISHLAARAIIFIEADNPAIGLMAFIGIGMDEVSTCEITVKEGQHVKKGDETGMFHFGGSTHCLLFRKGVKVEGFPHPGRATNIPVRSQVAVVKGN